MMLSRNISKIGMINLGLYGMTATCGEQDLLDSSLGLSSVYVCRWIYASCDLFAGSFCGSD